MEEREFSRTREGGVTVATGDRVTASIDGQSFTTQVNPSGVFEGLTIIRTANTNDPVTFSFRKGSTSYALVLAEGPPGVAHGREVVSLAVLAALLAQLGALYLRGQYGDPADVVRAVPKALRTVAPAATLL